MVESHSLDTEINNKQHFAELVGTKHLLTIVLATKGAIVVQVQIDGVIYAGVLLDAANSSIAPSLIKLPKVESGQETSKSTVTVEPAEVLDEVASPDIPGSACHLRHTYQQEPTTYAEPFVIPSHSASLASSLLRHQDRRQLRERKKSSKGQLFLCSMCKTHCFDTDNSDIENINTNRVDRKPESTKGAVPLTTPPIRISFKSPEGPSIMEIEPREYRKRKHSSKHKNKRHSKKSKRSDSHVNGDNVCTNVAVKIDALCDGDSLAASNPIGYNASEKDESADDNLVIDIPNERSLKLKRKSRSSTSKVTKRQDSWDSMSATSDVNNESSPPTKTKTKARLKGQKFAPKVDKKGKPADDVSVVSEKSTRDVSSYEGVGGKRISVGDVIWGKIIGFPWWPGRVCAITVSENADGIIMGHTADVDWYCSPTKSHLSCSDIYPFLEEFSKRLDKKKKSKGYMQAIDEAKRDAVMNEQYLQDLAEPEEDESEIPHEQTTTTMGTSPAHAAKLPEQVPRRDTSSECNSEEDMSADHLQMSGNNSPSLLIDAFLRTNESSSNASTQLNQECQNPVNESASAPGAEKNEDYNDELDGCLTISLPSPRSLLNSQ